MTVYDYHMKMGMFYMCAFSISEPWFGDMTIIISPPHNRRMYYIPKRRQTATDYYIPEISFWLK